MMKGLIAAVADINTHTFITGNNDLASSSGEASDKHIMDGVPP